MRMTILVWLCSLALALFVQRACAERPLEKKEAATNVVTGVIQKIEAKESKFGDDGVLTRYAADVRIDKVDRGEGLKVGDTVRAEWFHVTKRPSKPFPGAYGHAYAVKKGAAVQLYLVKGSGGGYEVIYNPAGIEPVKKGQ
jgi:hypothetical protein